MLKKVRIMLIAGYVSAVTMLNLSAQNPIPAMELTFKEALQKSLQNNHEITKAEDFAEMKLQEREASRGLYFPTLSLSANYMFLSDDIHLDLNPVKEAITPLYKSMGNYGNFSGVPNPDPATNQAMPILPDNISTQVVRGKLLDGLGEIEAANWDRLIQKKQFGMVGANIMYPLYAGGKIHAANKAATIAYNEALNDLNIIKDKTTTDVVARYFGLVLANEALQVREIVSKTMQLHVHDAKRMYEEGVISNTEYLHARVYQSEAERELKKAQHNINIVHEALLNIIAPEDTIAIKPLSILFYIDTMPSLPYFLTMAKKNSPLLEKITHKKELASTKYGVEKGSLLPNIYAMGTYDIINKDLSPDIPQYMVGIGMKWDIFNGLERYHKIKAAHIQQCMVNEAFNQASIDIETAITNYYETLSMQNDELHELLTAHEFAKEYCMACEKTFGEGMSTAAEISDANLALAKVEIEQLQAMYAFDVALSNLLYYSGLMSEFENYRQNGKTSNISTTN